MQPSDEQLKRWMMAHNVDVQFYEDRTVASAMDHHGEVITYITSETSTPLELCDIIAQRLLIIKPSLAFLLNGNP